MKGDAHVDSVAEDAIEAVLSALEKIGKAAKNLANALKSMIKNMILPKSIYPRKSRSKV